VKQDWARGFRAGEKLELVLHHRGGDHVALEMLDHDGRAQHRRAFPWGIEAGPTEIGNTVLKRGPTLE